MERFVTSIVAGGVALVAGLWLATLGPGSTARLAGAGLAVLGAAGLIAGIGSEITVQRG